ncbi:AFR659Wp [Eremothecium gossypii ATCC 10895]|uniref:Pre-mRNA-splicing factor CWC23 n=1 Tax=Eremothecium gossypii (strain ATCC 10895 / CBS 109.51 / FGSC 9923 / NRRL Y-1056) TaxID=284811 RepID=CWC23_EREGS|nr:AFR659Wp [Eremothecium gossypii ATCC 10895]Q752B6.1 RecName: Full=Pre-mRNA-splicing factor CWC23 [Eremothecium gossypii ATCC 10895]AAS54031.1 AFR659Wp [Eremothecium gossypii ATCC 10895]AEY98346.1 FAFR659Wp [Eremothecium gossypii FDAG1]
MSADALKDVIGGGKDLYALLEVSISSPEELEAVDAAQLRAQFRRLALRYHPDKRRDDTQQNDKFVSVQKAYDILSNSSLRATYNRWLSCRLFGDPERRRLVRELHQREQLQVRQKEPMDKDIQNIQSYGQLLRKMRHLRIPYGDWRPNTSISRDSTLVETCTLRLLLRQNSTTNSKSSMLQLFQRAKLHIVDLYFSSRNVDTENDLVLYAVMPDVDTMLDLLNNWAVKPPLSEHILQVQPRVHTDYFHFKTDISLDKTITEAIDADNQYMSSF